VYLDIEFNLLPNSQHKNDNSKGYTDERVKEVCEIVSGKNLDEFWQKYIKGTIEIPLEEYLNYAGLKLTNENDTLPASLDIEFKIESGKVIIAKVFKGGTAYESGLNINDELISIDGVRMDRELIKSFIKNYKTGDEINFVINRQGLIENVKVKLQKPLPKYKIIEMEEKTEEQNKIFEKWVSGN